MKPEADLSVLMATYNHAALLPRALDAILDQSVRPKEVIVVDDASTDSTAAILAGYVQRDPAVQVFRNKFNRGVNASSCLALASAGGKYVYFAGSDDRVLPGFIEKTMGMLSRYPEAGLCCSYHSTFDGITGEVRAVPSNWCQAPRYFAPAEVERVVGHASIAGHTSILKRSAVEAAGGFLADLEWYGDYFLTLAAAFREGMCHVPESLALLRVMPGTYSANVSGSDKQQTVLNAMFDRLQSPAYADVAASFRRSGALSIFGPDLLRAAANRPDLWSADILALINCFTPGQYETFLENPDPAVRKLAALFRGPFAHEVKAELDKCKKRCRELELNQASGAGRRLSVDWLKSTPAGKVLAVLGRSLRGVRRKFAQLGRRKSV